MIEKEFNLLDENWVRVITPDCKIREVSLTDAILHSHEYSDLCGELPTQNVAVMRLLLAVLHTVFSRVDKDGNPAPIESKREAFKRWKSLWDSKQFPEKPIRSYLETQREKFWLFHPERPFYQVPEKDFPRKKGKEKNKHGNTYSAEKLNGEIYESANKARLFSSKNGLNRDRLSYAEAARWIVSLQAFDDVAVKYINDREKGKQGSGVSWLGKLGIITAKGNNLFETLMLNFILLKDGSEIYGEERPTWEKERANSEEEVEIIVPNNLAELYTLQTRRMLLLRNDEAVTEYYLCHGDYFELKNAFIEPMTIWKSEKDDCVPNKHDSSIKMWREFAATFSAQGNNCVHTPGVVKWISKLQYENKLDDGEMIKFYICAAKYGASNSSIADVFSDELSFHRKLINDKEGWRSAISDEIGNCDNLAKEIGKLAKDLDSAMGKKERESHKAAEERKSHKVAEEREPYESAKEQLYFRIDVPFRNWLESIDSEWGTDEAEKDRECWRKTAQKIAVALGEEMVANAGEDAFTGRIIKEEEEGKAAKFYSSSKALLDFKYNVREIYN